MDLLSLRLFLRISQLNGLSPAAKDLKMSAATASARLNKLEEYVGVSLFHRTTRAVTLTSDGQAFLPHAVSALDSLENGLQAAGGGHVTPKGVLRMTMPGSFGRMHVVPLLAEFAQRYPKVELDLRLSDEILDVVEGAYDLIIRNAELSDSSLLARKLANDQRILVASPGYLAAFGEPQTPAQLVDHRCLVVSNHTQWDFESAGVIKIKPHMRINDGEAIRSACEMGLGITLKSRWNAHKALKEGRLVQVLEDWPLVQKQALWLAYPQTHMIAPKVRAMIDFLVGHFNPIAPWDLDDAR